MTRFQIALVPTLCALACATKQTSEKPPVAQPAPVAPAAAPPTESHPVGSKLMRDVQASDRTFSIDKNHGHDGLGTFSVRLDGKPLWPPHGDGCAIFERCCTQLATIADPLGLSCLLALGRDGSCPAARRTVTEIARENDVSPPEPCTR